MQYSDEHLRYLRLLSQKYQTVAAAASEVIRIEALLRLPKGTEHFMSDLHGEHEAFVHILNSASGVIREKIDTVLGKSVPVEERAELATLIYYPEQKLPELKARQKDLGAWYRLTLLRLIESVPVSCPASTPATTCATLPAPELAAISLTSCCHAHFEDHDKDQLLRRASSRAIIALRPRRRLYHPPLCEVIKRLAVDRLHIVGDLFDRGPRPRPHPRQPDGTPSGGHPVGQPRRRLDGRSSGQPQLCIMTVLNNDAGLQQPRHARRRLRHQPAAGWSGSPSTPTPAPTFRAGCPTPIRARQRAT